MKRKLGILTGGGDVQPLNMVLHSVWKECLKKDFELIGFIKGWQGVIEKNYVYFRSLKFNPLIGGSILKSSRVNLHKIANAKSLVKATLEQLDLAGLIVIGGEDTLSNAFLFRDWPIILISKTIDNDVGLVNEKIVNYFTLGYPTAAEKISQLISLRYGLRTTAYSHERIIVVESMGMHAGWLALAASMGDPDFIILPEFPLVYFDLLEKVVEVYKQRRHAIIVISEGARWSTGEYISADYTNQDPFGHPKFLGAATVLAKRLKEDLSQVCKNINVINPSYFYRSGQPNKLDQKAAIKAGKLAVNIISRGISEPMFLVSNIDQNVTFDTYPMSRLGIIDDFHRFVPEKFYDSSCYKITESGVEYLSKIISPIHEDQYNTHYFI
jgi:6-phosphofructokinase 1